MPRKRVYELDSMRSIAIFSVVALHALGFFYYSVDTSNGISKVLDGYFMYILRYARQIFMFLTGFVLVYNYAAKIFTYREFLWKRARGIVIPYIVWSFFYVGISIHYGTENVDGFSGYLYRAVQSVLQGDAFYHLYYVVVTVQFYLLFPMLLYLLKRMNRSRIWLAVVGISYVMLMAWMNWGWNQGVWDPRTWAWIPAQIQPIISVLVNHCDRIWFSYYGYYMLGGFAAIYLPAWKSILLKYSKYLTMGVGVFSLFFFIDYLVSVVHGQVSFAAEISIFKPSMFLYTILILGVLYNGAIYMNSKPYLQKILQKTANDSFGIYLIHPFVLFLFESYGLPYLNLARVPHVLQIILTVLIGISVSYGAARILRMIPILSWSLGVGSSKKNIHIPLPFRSLVQAFNR